MDLENQVPILILDVFEADIAQDTGVVDEDIDATEGLDGSVDDLLTVLDRVVVGDGLAAVLLDLVDDHIGCLYQWSDLLAWRKERQSRAGQYS